MHRMGPDDLRKMPEETAAERRPAGASSSAEHPLSEPASCRTSRPHGCLPPAILAPGRSILVPGRK